MMKKQITLRAYLLKAGFELCDSNAFENCALPYYAKDAVLLFFNSSPPDDTYLVGYGLLNKDKYYAATFRWVDKIEEVNEIYKAVTGRDLTSKIK